MSSVAEPKVGTFLKSLSPCLPLAVTQTYVSRLMQHLCFVKHIAVTQESGAKNNQQHLLNILFIEVKMHSIGVKNSA